MQHLLDILTNIICDYGPSLQTGWSKCKCKIHIRLFLSIVLELPIVAESPLDAMIVRNLPINNAGMFGLRAIVIQPRTPVRVQMMKQRRRPTRFERSPPRGQMHIAQPMYIAAKMGGERERNTYVRTIVLLPLIVISLSVRPNHHICDLICALAHPRATQKDPLT